MIKIIQVIKKIRYLALIFRYRLQFFLLLLRFVVVIVVVAAAAFKCRVEEGG